MRIERKRIAEMNRAPYNPRVELKPGDAEYESLARSIDQFGLVLPIIWNERTNNVVGGHQRLTVLEHRGEAEVDVSVVDLDETAEKQLNIALNKINGSWEEKSLLALLEELGDRATETGFSLPEIETLQNDINDLADDAFLEQELARIEQTFNISLKFSREDKEALTAYTKAFGKENLVRLIIDKVKGAI